MANVREASLCCGELPLQVLNPRAFRQHGVLVHSSALVGRRRGDHGFLRDEGAAHEFRPLRLRCRRAEDYVFLEKHGLPFHAVQAGPNLLGCGYLGNPTQHRVWHLNI